MEKTSVTLQDIHEAAERIRPYYRRTPLLPEQGMDKVLGCQAYLKPEMLQISGAFN
jgi:threonine dehydratase